ncbi:MAG: hypothetical protein K6F53_01940 [Lachnospiraceae bacterium]|nr:hypothetical protein [Lachnospiraceae bacterium]
MKSGYTDICADKFLFFSRLSSAAVLILILTGGVGFFHGAMTERSCRTDLFVLLWMAETVISFLFSIDRKTALFGTDGWYMGLFTLGILGALYFLISRLWKYSPMILYTALAFSVPVYLLGILDRFSIHLIQLELRDPSFISTLGNINWFMGYYSVLTAAGAGLLIAESKRNGSGKGTGLKTVLLSAWMVIAFAAGFAQGSDSVLLFFGALFAGSVLFYPEGAGEEGTFSGKIRAFLLLFLLFCTGASIIRLMRLLLPGYNYDSSGLLSRITEGPLPFILLLSGLILFILSRFLSGKTGEKMKTDRRLFLILLILPFFFWLATALLHTKAGLFPNLPDDLFLLDPHFGSGRGEAFRAALLTWWNLPLVNRLFGAGPDCFMTAAYSTVPLAGELTVFWPDDLLTNAHCEPLTVLVNGGIAGLICFYGMLFSVFFRDDPAGDDSVREDPDGDDTGSVLRLAVFCYMIHNLISFATILNLPFLMMLMAMYRSGKTGRHTQEIRNSGHPLF